MNGMLEPEDGSVVLTGDATLITVPSGQAVQLQDAIWNVDGPLGLTLRFRFVAPAIAPGGGVDVETAQADMQALCDSFALPRVSGVATDHLDGRSRAALR